MQILIIDREPATRATLRGRASLAIRQAEIRRVDLIDQDLDALATLDPNVVHGILMGPGCYELLDQIIPKVRSFLPSAPLAIVLEGEVYNNQAVNLRRHFDCKVISMSDLAQLASFCIDCEEAMVRGNGKGNRGIFGVAQLKGGVGATSIVAALASCWARHGLSVVALDFDDINPQLTAWGRVGAAQRVTTAELLRHGKVPANRLNEIIFPVEGFEGRLNIIGQPEQYHQGFHFKADVLENAPSSSEFVASLLQALRDEVDVTIIDLSKSWGVAAFAALPFCQEILLITDDDGMSVRCTLDNLYRLRRESDDPNELDLNRWSIVLNGYTGRLISPSDLANEIEDLELLPSDANLYTIPFTERGRQWGAPGRTMFELGEDGFKHVLIQLAASLVPFRYHIPQDDLVDRVAKTWKRLIGKER